MKFYLFDLEPPTLIIDHDQDIDPHVSILKMTFLASAVQKFYILLKIKFLAPLDQKL